MKVINENYVKLTEASLNRLVRGHDKDGYAVLSASRNERSTEENNKKFEELKKDIKSLGYSYVPVFGGYIETTESGERVPVYEKSLYVLPFRKDGAGGIENKDFNKFVEDMFKLGNKYNQEQILLKYADKSPAYYGVSSKNRDMEFTGKTSFNDIKQDYFTSLKKWDGKNSKGGSSQRFSFSECYLNEQPHTIAGAHVRSLNGELVYFSKNGNKLFEGSTSRLYNNITNMDSWAIISPFRSERSYKENMELLRELKNTAKKYGFVEFVSRWVEDGEAFDERSLFISNIPKAEAVRLGKKYNQSSVIVKDENGCYEVCTTPFEAYSAGDVVRRFNIDGKKVLNVSDAENIFSKRVGGPVSKPVKGNRPFTLKTVDEMYEVEQPRPSYFQKEEKLRMIYKK
ncbi:MAG: DUF3293 domain-containing protein [Methanobrevibacter sp.]|nr:DUF3293 domain-containing protein [Methanobrevibacter sp.]